MRELAEDVAEFVLLLVGMVVSLVISGVCVLLAVVGLVIVAAFVFSAEWLSWAWRRVRKAFAPKGRGKARAVEQPGSSHGS